MVSFKQLQHDHHHYNLTNIINSTIINTITTTPMQIIKINLVLNITSVNITRTIILITTIRTFFIIFMSITIITTIIIPTIIISVTTLITTIIISIYTFNINILSLGLIKVSTISCPGVFITVWFSIIPMLPKQTIPTKKKLTK